MTDPKYSTFRPRLVAFFVDWLICIPFFTFFSALECIFESVASHIVFYLITSSAWLIYSISMHARYGQTLGKKYARIVVLDVSERPLSLRQALWRDGIGLIIWMLGLAADIPRILQGVDLSDQANLTTFNYVLIAAGCIWCAMEFVTMFTNDKRRAAHDFLAGSVVVRLPAREPQEQLASALS